jgi:hypothetical protein
MPLKNVHIQFARYSLIKQAVKSGYHTNMHRLGKVGLKNFDITTTKYELIAICSDMDSISTY